MITATVFWLMLMILSIEGHSTFAMGSITIEHKLDSRVEHWTIDSFEYEKLIRFIENKLFFGLMHTQRIFIIRLLSFVALSIVNRQSDAFTKKLYFFWSIWLTMILFPVLFYQFNYPAKIDGSMANDRPLQMISYLIVISQSVDLSVTVCASAIVSTLLIC